MPTIKTRDGVNLYVKEWGEGRPVVLIHGWPLSSDSWDAVSLALARSGCRVVAYDRRGFGRSDQPWNGYDYNTLADDLADVMEATGVVENAFLAGFSMGGGEVARYMTKYGAKKVAGTALISSIVPCILQKKGNTDGVPQSQFDIMKNSIVADRPAFMREFLNDFFGVGVITSPVSQAVLNWAWRMCMQAGLRPTLECLTAFSTADFREELGAFSVPTLIVHGTSDKTVPIDASGRAAARGINGATAIEYDGAPHGVFATHTDRLISDIMTMF
jgi:non-heme chloroperoxidase